MLYGPRTRHQHASDSPRHISELHKGLVERRQPMKSRLAIGLGKDILDSLIDYVQWVSRRVSTRRQGSVLTAMDSIGLFVRYLDAELL